jgi:hypothetical protein
VRLMIRRAVRWLFCCILKMKCWDSAGILEYNHCIWSSNLQEVRKTENRLIVQEAMFLLNNLNLLLNYKDNFSKYVIWNTNRSDFWLLWSMPKSELKDNKQVEQCFPLENTFCLEIRLLGHTHLNFIYVHTQI